jgi:hypothetical protein
MFLGRFSTFYVQDDAIPDFEEADKIVVLKRLPATTLSYAKLQPAAQLKRQTNNSGNGDSGNGNGNSGSNNGNNNNGGGGSSTTDRNIALGVGLGVGIPGAIAGMITIYKFCCRGDGDESDGEAKQKKKKEKHLRRSLPSPQDPRTHAHVPEPRGASELASQQPQRPYELATYG